MQTPLIDQVFSTTLGGDYLEEPFNFFVGDNGPADDFSNCTISGGIYQGGQLRLDISAYAAISAPATVSISIPKAQMATIGAGDFVLQLWLVTPGGQTQELIAYALRVRQP